MKNVFSLFLLSLVLHVSAQNGKIVFEAPHSYPEGITHDATRNVWYVSSVTTGTVGVVDMSGKYKELLRDSSLKSTFGMKLSADGKKLWVCAGDPNYSKWRDSLTFKKMIRIICLDPVTGKKSKDIDLSSLYNGKHFPNDLVIDNKGNLYITDSFSPVIYKIDANGSPAVLAENSLFKAIGVGLNGICWHPAGYLLVVNNSNGAVIKVPLNGAAPAMVKVAQFFPGGDGILLDENQNLILVQNKGVNKVFRLTSKDDWSSAAVTGATAATDRFSYPSTATLVKNEVWVMNAKLNELSDSNTVLSDKFIIQRANFK